MTAIVLAVLLGATGANAADDDCTGTVDVNGVLVAQQCWSAEERNEFYFTSQGSQLMPYAWLLALERESSTEKFFTPGAGLSRFGYLQDPNGETPRNPDNLPIGFVKDTEPGSDDSSCEFVGMTCAACHTTQFQRAPASGSPHILIVDGAPASADMYDFVYGLAKALGKTGQDGTKLAAFSARLPKEEQDGGACRTKGTLKDALNKKSEALLKLLDPPDQPASPEWGPARLDAVGIIINQIVTHLELGDANLGPVNAPVSYPFIWDVHQHNQVQWNGVAGTPLVRNTVEVMGVFAEFGPKTMGFRPFDFYLSSVRFGGMKTLEGRVKTLRSPVWPAEFFGTPLDDSLVQQGKVIFESSCAECHSSVPRDEDVPHIKAVMTPLDEIGTDPAMAINFAERNFVDPDEKLFRSPPTPASCSDNEPGTPVVEQALNIVVPRMFWNDLWVVASAFVETVRSWFSSQDSNRCAYKGRPLDGIWATAPYLHNGSVPNLEELLKPPAQRIPKFCVSQIQSVDPAIDSFDPKKVGLPSRSACRPDEFTFDTTLPGNLNGGHEYFFRTEGNRAFTESEIKALVEYQKSL